MYNLSVRRGQTIGAIRPGGGHVQRLRPLGVGGAERGLERPPSLDEEARPAFEPMALFGSLTPERRDRISDERPWRRVSFGSLIWMYDAAVAGAVLAALAPDLAEAGAEMLASLGRHPMADGRGGGSSGPTWASRAGSTSGCPEGHGPLRDPPRPELESRAMAPRRPVESRSVEGAAEVILARREAFATRPDQARRWELNVIEGRAAALDHRLALVR